MKSIINSYIKFLLYGLFFIPLLISSQEINWITMDEAVRLQKQYPKKIIIDMYTTWCGPCRMLDRNTFSNKSLAEYVNTNFYAVKFNAEGNEIINFNGQQFTNPNYDPEKSRRRNSQHQLAQYFGVRSYPTILFLGEKGEFLAPIPGYKPPSKLEFFLKLFGEDHYKNLKSKEAFNSFRKLFKPSFSP